MELSSYLAEERGRSAKVARILGIPAAWLSQMAAGIRPIPPAFVPTLEGLSELRVRRWDLRPIDWHRIWPELIAVDGAPPVPETATQPGALDEAAA